MASPLDVRRSYAFPPLLEEGCPASPHELFDRWMSDAKDQLEPNAMTLATVDADGRPQARVVLLRGHDPAGFTFFTNYDSDKGHELRGQPQACLLFFWDVLARQVRIGGRVEQVPVAESEAYFASRPREHQLGAWASAQSRVLPSRAPLEQAYAEYDARFTDKVPRPPHWGGYRLVATEVEFWQGRLSRLHDRLRYRLVDGRWLRERLSP